MVFSNYATGFIVDFSLMAGTKKTKYDTNPLDPDFPEKSGATQMLGVTGAETRQFPPPAPTEQETQRFDQQQYPQFQQYQQPSTGQYAPAYYHQGHFQNVEHTAGRKVEKIGLKENIVTALPYIPWYFGLVAGVILLFLLPRSEGKARFHAAQGLAVHAAILAITTLLGAIGNIAGPADAANIIFQIIMTIMLIVWTIKAFKGKPVHIETVDSLTNWLDEKIGPELGKK
jgi:uncharacterized membrane protein